LALTPGTTLGSYEIIGTLGAGGMGEVYRGRDPKLERDVAIQVLPESFLRRTADGRDGAAARAEPATLAAERNQLLRLTGLAADAQEPFFQTAALQKRVELILYIPRQRPALGDPPVSKPRIVFGHELIEQCRFGPMPRIAWWRNESLRLRDVAVRPSHPLRPCTASTGSA